MASGSCSRRTSACCPQRLVPGSCFSKKMSFECDRWPDVSAGKGRQLRKRAAQAPLLLRLTGNEVHLGDWRYLSSANGHSKLEDAAALIACAVESRWRAVGRDGGDGRMRARARLARHALEIESNRRKRRFMSAHLLLPSHDASSRATRLTIRSKAGFVIQGPT